MARPKLKRRRRRTVGAEPQVSKATSAATVGVVLALTMGMMAPMVLGRKLR